MTDRCHDIADLGALAELPPGDPRRSHVDSCPHCRALLAAFSSFEQGCPSAGDIEREQALAGFLDRNIGAADVANGGAETGGIFRLAGSRFLAPGLAVAAVLVLSLAFQQYRTTTFMAPSAITRGAAETDLHLAVAFDGQGGVHLQWDAPAGAESYVIVLYGPDLQELVSLDMAGETSLTIPPARLNALRPDAQSLLWRVRAYRAGDLLVVSAPGVIPAGNTP